jgi:hypothetical protein
MKTTKSLIPARFQNSEFLCRVLVWTSSVHKFVAVNCAASTLLALACLLLAATPARGQLGTNQQSVLVVTLFDAGYAPYMNNYYQTAQMRPMYASLRMER